MRNFNSLLIHKELRAQAAAKASFQLKYPYSDLGRRICSMYSQMYPPWFTTHQNHFWRFVRDPKKIFHYQLEQK